MSITAFPDAGAHHLRARHRRDRGRHARARRGRHGRRGGVDHSRRSWSGSFTGSSCARASAPALGGILYVVVRVRCRAAAARAAERRSRRNGAVAPWMLATMLLGARASPPGSPTPSASMRCSAHSCSAPRSPRGPLVPRAAAADRAGDHRAAGAAVLRLLRAELADRSGELRLAVDGHGRRVPGRLPRQRRRVLGGRAR